MTLYFDSSAIVSLFLDEPRADAVTDLIAGTSETILSSDLLVGEFGAAIATAVRTQRLPANAGERVYEMFDAWIIGATVHVPIDPDALRTAGAWVRRHDLALLFPDAVHIALSKAAGARLITGDRQQANAATVLNVQVTLLE